MWKDPRVELPQEGQYIWVIDCHWKGNIPGSFRIYGGRYDDGELHTDDDFGEGGFKFPFPRSAEWSMSRESVYAWCCAEEIPIPDWLVNFAQGK